MDEEVLCGFRSDVRKKKYLFACTLGYYLLVYYSSISDGRLRYMVFFLISSTYPYHTFIQNYNIHHHKEPLDMFRTTAIREIERLYIYMVQGSNDMVKLIAKGRQKKRSAGFFCMIKL